MTDRPTPTQDVFRHTGQQMLTRSHEAHTQGVSTNAVPAEPEAMRQLVSDYVLALHGAYLDHTRHLPAGERGRLPLVAGQRVTVVAAATRQLHLLATADHLPAPQGPEVEIVEDYLGLTWVLRFYDPSVLPALGLLQEDQPAEVRRVLGMDDVLYHLTVDVGGGLGPHHAQHSGVALANQHAKTGRDLEGLRHALPLLSATVDEFGVCVRRGLPRASALLAAELTEHRVSLPAGVSALEALRAVLDDVSR
jgi:hypothetical protein